MAIMLKINIPRGVDYDSLMDHLQQALVNTGLLEEDYVGISDEFRDDHQLCIIIGSNLTQNPRLASMELNINLNAPRSFRTLEETAKRVSDSMMYGATTADISEELKREAARNFQTLEEIAKKFPISMMYGATAADTNEDLKRGIREFGADLTRTKNHFIKDSASKFADLLKAISEGADMEDAADSEEEENSFEKRFTAEDD